MSRSAVKDACQTLWRVLVAQALLHRELLRAFRTRARSSRPFEQIARVPDEEFELLAWSAPKAPGVLEETRRPFAAASRYFATHLPVLFDALRHPPHELPEGPAHEPARALQTAS